MTTIYVLNYEETELLGYRIFSDYNAALKEFLSHCIAETKSLLQQEEEDDYDMTKCTLEIKNLELSEYETLKEYDYDDFENLIESKEDVEEYLDLLQKMIDENKLDDEIIKLFRF
jgi:hypothetical protein